MLASQIRVEHLAQLRSEVGISFINPIEENISIYSISIKGMIRKIETRRGDHPTEESGSNLTSNEGVARI